LLLLQVQVQVQQLQLLLLLLPLLPSLLLLLLRGLGQRLLWWTMVTRSGALAIVLFITLTTRWPLTDPNDLCGEG